MDNLRSAIGLLALVLLAWGLSEDRKRLSLRTLAAGVLLQLVLALLLLKVPGSQGLFMGLNEGVSALERSTRAGTSFVFGFLGGGAPPYEEKVPGASYILAFRGLPLVLLMSALSSLLFYWRIIPLAVGAFSWMMRKTMRIGGVEGLGTAANVFVGMVESPLLVRPYLASSSRSELFTIMTSGMATIAGTVMVLYASVLKDVIPGVMGHLLTASLISAPAAVTVSKLMIPEKGRVSTESVRLGSDAASAMDALTRGALDGIRLLMSIVAMLIVLVALVHLVNLLLGYLPRIYGNPVSLQGLLGYGMAPLVWLMGIPWSEAHISGALMGTKTVLNEFLAYLEMAALPTDTLSERTRLIMTYAMCGFANFGSLGILIGGLGAMVPEKRKEVIALGFKSVVAGTLATCMTGAIVGILC